MKKKTNLSKTVEKLTSDNETLANLVKERDNQIEVLKTQVENLTEKLRNTPMVYTRPDYKVEVSKDSEAAEAVVEVAEQFRQ